MKALSKARVISLSNNRNFLPFVKPKPFGLKYRSETICFMIGESMFGILRLRNLVNFTFFLSLNLLAASENCVHCGQKTVVGSPDVGTSTLDKVAMAVESSTKFKALSGADYRINCTKFQKASNYNTIIGVLSELKENNIDHEEIFTKAECDGTNIDGKMPMIQLAAENMGPCKKFPEQIYNYFKDVLKKDESSWKKVVNTLNTRNMTFLDFLYFNFKKDPSELAKNNLAYMFKFVCTHGGEFSKYAKEGECINNPMMKL